VNVSCRGILLIDNANLKVQKVKCNCLSCLQILLKVLRQTRPSGDHGLVIKRERGHTITRKFSLNWLCVWMTGQILLKPIVTELECASCRGRSPQYTSSYWVDLCTCGYGTTLSVHGANCGVVTEQMPRKERRVYRGVIWGTIPEFSWNNWGKSRKIWANNRCPGCD
jgi:hypothetical protein